MELVNFLSMLRHEGINVLNKCLANTTYKSTVNYNKLTLKYNLLKNVLLNT